MVFFRRLQSFRHDFNYAVGPRCNCLYIKTIVSKGRAMEQKQEAEGSWAGLEVSCLIPPGLGRKYLNFLFYKKVEMNIVLQLV